MEVPSIDIVAFDEVMEMVGGAEKIIVGILFQILGEAPGMVYLLFSMEEAETLVQEMTNNSEFTLFSEGEQDELAVSRFFKKQEI